MAEALAVVKVGNSECGLLKLTPLSRTYAMAGAVCGVSMRPRNPSGTNRIRLCGVAFCADAVPADSIASAADSRASERRIKISLGSEFTAGGPPPLFSFALQQICYISPAPVNVSA